jgi:hypothetical protein
MRKILIFLALMALVFSASAAWYPRSADYTTTGDVNGDNGNFTGNMTIAGILSYGTNVSEGKISENLWIDDGLQVTDTAALNATTATTLAVSSTTDLNGAATTKGITLDANSNLALSGTGTATAPTFIGNVKIPDFFSIGLGRVVDTNYTYPSGGKMDSIVIIDPRSYNSTLTLLPAAQAPGNLTIVKLGYLPGAYYAKINVTGGGLINGAAILKTTDDAGTFLPSVTLWSSGTLWYVVDAIGTWTSTSV